MPEFTARDVQALRQATGAGMMDAKKALQENNGDAVAAEKWLREKGLGKASERAGRENIEGAVAIAASGNAAAAVELKCETDFVAKSDGFVDVADRLAQAVLADGEGAVDTLKDAVDDLKVTLKENIEVGDVVRVEAATGNILDTYLHRQEGRGKIGVIVELSGGTPELAHEVAIQIAFTKPPYLSREDVPADLVAAERETLESITRAEGKPEQAIPKIIDGRLKAWFRDQALLEQPYVRDEKQTVAQLIGDATIARFVLVAIGG